MSAVRLTEAQRGVLLSSMSDSSCGLTLGRSTAWVVRMRRALDEPASPPPPAPAPEPVPEAVQALPAKASPPEPRPTPVQPASPGRRQTSQHRPASSRSASVVRLKPVTADIARWARAFLASPLWTADEVADLFGVHPDALVDVVAA